MPGNTIPHLSRLLKPVIDRVQMPLASYRWTIGAVLLATISGAVLAGVAMRIEPDERIVTGNTSGTLTTLLDLNAGRIMVGAGPSRSHAADLLGRSTRPWDRTIDLLVLPGWDDTHVPGALGLIERQSVSGIAVVGIPGDEPSWTLLEREVERRDIRIRYLDSTSKLSLSEHSALTFSLLGSDQPGGWIRLAHYDKLIDIVDARDSASGTPDIRAMSTDDTHVRINLRDHHQPLHATPELLIFPQPFWNQDFEEIASPYVVEVDRNEHVTISLKPEELSLPLQVVDVRPD